MPKHILLINDDQLVAKSLAETLHLSGYEAKIALNTDVAYKYAKSDQIDLIVSDIRMPDESGIEIVQTINRLARKKIPVIFTAGMSDNVYIEETKRFGYFEIMVRPFESTFFIERIEKLLHGVTQESNQSIIQGYAPPSQMKRFFYSALGSQWNPEREIDWNGKLGINESLCKAMAYIISPIVMGEYSAFHGLPQRILSFSSYEVKQYLSAQLVDETRHSEAFDLYLMRIDGVKDCKNGFRNLYTLRFFNGLKKLKDNDEWIVGLYLTEIMAHLLLSNYVEKTECKLTRHLFKMILFDEGRHLSFANFYLKEILARSSPGQKLMMLNIIDYTLGLTKGMLYSYADSYKAFNMNCADLYEQIAREIDIRVTRKIMTSTEHEVEINNE